MTRNVSEQELDALLTREETPQSQIEARDFREPRWLPPEDLGGLRIRGRTAGTAAVDALRAALPGEIELEHVEVTEGSLESARRPQDERVVLACDGSAGPSVAMMDRSAALQLVELALGGGIDPAQASRTQARPLSPFEAEIVERLLGSAFARVSQAFGSAVKSPRLVTDPVELGRLLPSDGDQRRLAVRAAIAAGSHKLVFHFLLAGIAPEPRKSASSSPPKRPPQGALPAELASTHVEVSAVLGELEIMLTDLLALETGDLIPLSVAPGEPIDVRIEGEPCGRARFGERAGHLAVRMIEVFRPPPIR